MADHKGVTKFDPVTVRDLFGSLDAEQEDIERFKDYFVTNNFYELFVADFPLRIAVGNKGSGKSAMLRASRLQAMSRSDCIPVSLTASDLITEVEELPPNILRAINHWKAVFAAAAAGQIFTDAISGGSKSELSKAMTTLPTFISYLAALASKKTKGASDIVIRSGLYLNSIKTISFYIDDLDRAWDGSERGIHFINSLLTSCFDISKSDKRIRFNIAIRWDLWDEISRINPDIDKMRENAIFLRWSIHDIYVVIAKRVSRYFNITFKYGDYLGNERLQEEIARIFDPIMESRFFGYGKWDNTSMRHVLLSMIRARPRDLITLLTLAAEEAYRKNRNKINSTDFQNIFPRYSEDRLNDLIVEFGTRLSGLESILLSFKPSKATGRASESFRFTNDKLITHVKEAIRLNRSKIGFSNESGVPDFRRIIDFLYRIDFLQAWYRQSDGLIERVNFQDRQLVVSDSTDFGYSWEVLPAYRWAIQPTNISDVIASLR